MPDNPISRQSFATFAEWREFVLRFNLRHAIPPIVSAKFERAQKLLLLTWADFDLIRASELVALTALETAVRDRYGGGEIERRRRIVAEKAKKKKREVFKKEREWADKTTFADLLKYMVEHDGLTEAQVPMNRRCGPNSKVIGLLTGGDKPTDPRPTLVQIRNNLMHGAPFDDPRAGLLELVRDLIDYAYRDWNLHAVP
jgi:hypothetical protein